MQSCDFCPGHGTLDQIFSLEELRRGLWEFASSLHVLWNWRILMIVFTRSVVGEWGGGGGALLGAIRSLNNLKQVLSQYPWQRVKLVPGAS